MDRGLRGLCPAWLSLVLLGLYLVASVDCVKRENFKTCDQSGFCKRNRAYADEAAAAGAAWNSPYVLDSQTVSVTNGELTGTVWKELGSGNGRVELPLVIQFQNDGVARVTVDEAKRQKGEITLRHGSQARKERYNEAEKWALVRGLRLDVNGQSESTQGQTIVTFGPENKFKAVIKHKPFAVDFVRDGKTQVKLNGHGLFNLEHWREKVDKPADANEDGNDPQGPDESTWWEESFGGNVDTKPRGPESIGLDITFPDYEHVYGVAGHASSLALKETRGADGGYDEPYRLYNSDVFEYEMDSPMTLYGAIPFMYAHRKDSTVGVFWLNAAESWIDITKINENANSMSLGTSGTTDTKTHWFSETGLLDVFVFLGPDPKSVLNQYASLTGYTQLPQAFSIAYHQCRWNYVTDEDVKDVDKKFSKHQIPYDVIWLDIEYTDGKKYFTWDPHTFANPIDMQKQLDASERKLVAIIDPHIKNEGGYDVSEQLKQQNLAVKNKDNQIYEGWCWPGSSHWVDCFNPAARKWWNSLFTYKSFAGTASNTFLWNDMNEPSVFNGPETTMPKDNIHYGNWEHRDVHNINGLTFHNASYEAMKLRDSPSKRPFVLTRSYYSGSQRVGAMWTGDNQAVWPHLAASIPMVLSMNIAGFPFAGADVGGFFGNPSKELLTRWYQAGIFYPFFRGHAHIDTRRREPYLVGDPYKEIITQALRLRYSLLPTWYTTFHEASKTGAAIIRPHFYVHPEDSNAFALDDQFYLGSSGLLVKPVVTEGAESVDIYLPPGFDYFDYFTYTKYTGQGKRINIAAPLDKIPILMQEGHVIPRKDRPRKSSGLMRYDPYTLLIILDKHGNAHGDLYIDDGESFDYEKGAFIHRQFSFSDGKTLTSISLADASSSSEESKKYIKTMSDVQIEKIILVNAPQTWKAKQTVQISSSSSDSSGGNGGDKASMAWFDGKDGSADYVIIKKPGLKVIQDWKVEI